MPGPLHPRPMFPLGSVLFPYALLPLHVFEPRYRVMMRRCLDTDREFGVVLIERGSEVGGGDVRFDVGTVARIVQASELADGRWSIVTVGMRRARVVRWLPDDPFPNAEVEELEERPTAADDVAARDRVVAALSEVVALWRQLDSRVTDTLPPFDEDPVRAVFEVAAVSPIQSLDAQRILEAPDTTTRAALLEAMLRDRAEDLKARLNE